MTRNYMLNKDLAQPMLNRPNMLKTIKPQSKTTI